MVKVLAVVVLLAVAQILPSCGGGPGSSGEPASGGAEIIGWVGEKRTRIYETTPWIIVINQVEHGVPYEFWTTVDVGDLVKFDGQRWSIVRKARR